MSYLSYLRAGATGPRSRSRRHPYPVHMSTRTRTSTVLVRGASSIRHRSECFRTEEEQGRVNFFRNVVTAVPKARFRLWRSESLEEQRHPSTLVGMPGDSRERAGRRTAADAVDVQVLEEGGQSLQRTGESFLPRSVRGAYVRPLS